MIEKYLEDILLRICLLLIFYISELIEGKQLLVYIYLSYKDESMNRSLFMLEFNISYTLFLCFMLYIIIFYITKVKVKKIYSYL
jgi:hypothetical protein